MPEQTPTTPGFRAVPRTGVIYVMNRAIEEGYSYGNTEWANLGQGAPEAGTLPGAPERISTIDVTESENEYSPVSGNTELRQAVADYYNRTFRKGKKSLYTYRNVAISGGGRTGLTRIAAALGDINLGHFIPDYTAYEELLSVFKAFTPIPIILDPENNYTITQDELRKEINGRGLSAILLSNPCNPTGKLVQGGELKGWVETAREQHCTLIFDEFYSHYIYNQEEGAIFSSAEFVENVNEDPVVIIDGITKNWRYPGWRISWTIAPENVIDAIASAGSFLDGGANHPLQKAVISQLDEEHMRQETHAIQSVFSKKRAFMLEGLRDLGFVIENEPQGSFYVWANLKNLPKKLQEGMELFEAGLKNKVITVPGQFFDVNPGKRRSHFHSRYKNYARMSYGPDMPTLERGLAALEKTIRQA